MRYTVIGSVMAGAMIALGGLAYMSVENHVIGSALFSLGLITIVALKYDLFTGKAGHWIDYEFDELSDMGFNLACLAIIFGLNLVGVVGVSVLFTFAGLLPDMCSVGDAKMSMGFTELWCRAVLCGMLMCIAVDGYKRFGNILVIMLPVMVFILCGLEHSVADMFYLIGGAMNSHVSLHDIISRLGVICWIGLGNLAGGTIVWTSIKHIEQKKD